jgi:glycosyltransferase involved in cell wall biosynthesis
MRVAILIDGLAVGGAERQALQAAALVARAGCAVELIHYHPVDELRAGGRGRAPGVRVSFVPKGSGPSLLVPRLGRHLRRWTPDVLHAFKARSTLYAALAGRVARVPVVLGGCRGQYEEDAFTRMVHRLTRGLLDGWIVNSRGIAASLIEAVGVREQDCFVVYNGVDREALASTLDAAAARRKFGLDPAAETATIIGGLRPIKNHALFLEMACRVAGRRPSAQFLVAGDGELRPVLRRRRAGRDPSRDFRSPPGVGTSWRRRTSACSRRDEGMASRSWRQWPGFRSSALMRRRRRSQTDGRPVVPAGCGRSADRVGRILGDAKLRRLMGEAAAATVRERFGLEAMAAGLIEVYRNRLYRVARGT